MLATVRDPAASPAVGAGFAAERRRLAGLPLPGSFLLLSFVTWEGIKSGQHRLGKGMAQPGGGPGGCPASGCRQRGHVLYRRENQAGN